MNDDSHNALNRRIEKDQKVIAAWAEKLATNPTHAFNWSEDAMEAAARLEINTIVRDWLADGQDKEKVKAHIMDQVMFLSRTPESSTSAARNIMERYKLQAYAELVDGMDRLFK